MFEKKKHTYNTQSYIVRPWSKILSGVKREFSVKTEGAGSGLKPKMNPTAKQHLFLQIFSSLIFWSRCIDILSISVMEEINDLYTALNLVQLNT